MANVIALNPGVLQRLDLSPVQRVVEPLLDQGAVIQEPCLQFAIDYPRDPSDPRELSEIPEVRLWFVRLDAYYPWLPLWLDWQAGELGRYTAMLVPHQFSAQEGIQYNPEALEIFLMSKLFILSDWLRQHSTPGTEKLKGMAKVLGYELEDELFTLLQVHFN